MTASWWPILSQSNMNPTDACEVTNTMNHSRTLQSAICGYQLESPIGTRRGRTAHCSFCDTTICQWRHGPERQSYRDVAEGRGRTKSHIPIRRLHRHWDRKQMYSVPCPLCGAAVGMQCELYSGGRRNSPHVDRKLYTLEAIEGRESEAIKDQSGQLVASLAYKRGDMSRSA
jgi:hypothetical protein